MAERPGPAKALGYTRRDLVGVAIFFGSLIPCLILMLGFGWKGGWLAVFLLGAMIGLAISPTAREMMAARHR